MISARRGPAGPLFCGFRTGERRGQAARRAGRRRRPWGGEAAVPEGRFALRAEPAPCRNLGQHPPGRHRMAPAGANAIPRRKEPFHGKNDPLPLVYGVQFPKRVLFAVRAVHPAGGGLALHPHQRRARHRQIHPDEAGNKAGPAARPAGGGDPLFLRCRQPGWGHSAAAKDGAAGCHPAPRAGAAVPRRSGAAVFSVWVLG